MKSHTFNNVFAIEFSLTIGIYEFFFKLLDLHKSYLNFSGKIFSKTLLFPNLKVEFSVAEIVKRIFL